jgi:hypothetical protein
MRGKTNGRQIPLSERVLAYVWVALLSLLAYLPSAHGWELARDAFGDPVASNRDAGFPQPLSLPDTSWTRPFPKVDEETFDDRQVKQASYLNEAVDIALLESVHDLQPSCRDGLCGPVGRSGAAAGGSEYGRGMTLVLDDEGKKYIRFLTWNQVWTNFTENNPGTVTVQNRGFDADGKPVFDQQLEDNSLDIGLRRTRFLTYSQLTERYLILLHVGLNNQTFSGGGGSGTVGFGPYGVGKKPQIFVHDVWNEYAVIPQSECGEFSLAVGAGLHYWNGVSRKSSSSTMGYMALDAPIFCWPNIEFSDQFARQLGWYAKGKFHQLDYRVSVNHPFNTDDGNALYQTDAGGNLVNPDRAVNIASDTLAYAGYFEWQFWDEESNLLPYKTSTWLGERSVFNLGAGFYFHPNASGILDAAGQLKKQHQLAVGVDCYLDKPVGECGAAFTFYGVYYIFDYGDNYFRNIGIMNTGRLGTKDFLAAEGVTPNISGAGNAQPFLGTGEILYLEAGYVLPTWLLAQQHGKLQPFGAFTHKNLAFLDDPAFNWDMGVNYLIDGHRAKLTFQYSLRPQFFERTDAGVVERVSEGFAGQFTIQAQIAL